MDKDKIKVSILCITYNQASYINQAIDGFLLQKTNFNYEILINDDASKDSTPGIIKSYQNKYPDKIKPIFQKENQYSQGKRNFFSRFLIPKARGQYLALCEGDDYWTDPYKLQKQVDFLDKNPECSICFHPAQVVYQNGEKEDAIFPEKTDLSFFTIANLLRDNFIQTNSVMYRRQKYSDMPTDVMPADLMLHLYHAQFGKIGFIPDVMSVYRRHEGGIWWGSHNDKMEGIYKQHRHMLIRAYEEMLNMFGHNEEYKDIINAHISYLLNRFIEIDQNENSSLIESTIKGHTLIVSEFIERQKELIDSLKSEIRQLNDLNEKARHFINIQDEKLRSINPPK